MSPFKSYMALVEASEALSLKELSDLLLKVRDDALLERWEQEVLLERFAAIIWARAEQGEVRGKMAS
jgi:hypothetical protein